MVVVVSTNMQAQSATTTAQVAVQRIVLDISMKNAFCSHLVEHYFVFFLALEASFASGDICITENMKCNAVSMLHFPSSSDNVPKSDLPTRSLGRPC